MLATTTFFSFNMGSWNQVCSCCSRTSFTRRQWIILLVFSLAYLFSACVISLQAPFYPAEAERKGATATEYGLVFGIFQLICFCISPIYGKHMNKFGAKPVLTLGIFITGCSCFFFGFLDRIYDHFFFIFLSFLIRIFEAIGSTGFVTAAFTIIAGEFPTSVATTFASLETMYGLGLIIGPSLGGALYEVGGFTTPFAFTGIALVLVALVTTWLLPEGESMNGGDCKDSEGIGILQILKLPAVQLSALNIWMGTNSSGFLSATLEPHLRQFQLDVFQIGLIFMLTGAAYGLSAPLWGKLMDKLWHPKYVVVIGSLFFIAAHMLIGPAPFLPFDTSFPLTCIGLILHGIGVGASQVSAFILPLRASIANGFPDNLNLYSAVSAMWASFLSLGLFIGPTIGGILWDEVGYRVGSLYPFIAAIVVLVLGVIYLVINYQNSGESRRNSYSGSEAETMLPLFPDTISPRKSTKGIEKADKNILYREYGTLH